MTGLKKKVGDYLVQGLTREGFKRLASIADDMKMRASCEYHRPSNPKGFWNESGRNFLEDEFTPRQLACFKEMYNLEFPQFKLLTKSGFKGQVSLKKSDDLIDYRRAFQRLDFYYDIFHSSRFPPNGRNRGRYSNSLIDQLTEEGRVTLDLTKRMEIYSRIQKIVAQELPYISLWHTNNVSIIHKRVKGYRQHPMAGFFSFKEIELE